MTYFFVSYSPLIKKKQLPNGLNWLIEVDKLNIS